MDGIKFCSLEFFPENILVDVLSYLSIRELVRAGRVCKKWKRLVKDQRLWRNVDLCSWKGVTSRILWVILRQYLGGGLRSLRLRGLLLSARGGTFLSESWLKVLSTKCPRLIKLYLLHADLRGLPNCQILPSSLRVLELHGCELPRSFFTQELPGHDKVEATSSVGIPQQRKNPVSATGISIESLVLNNVPSFTDEHLLSLASWQGLCHLELRDTFRITANGLRSCAAKDGISGIEGLSKLKFLVIGITGRQGYQLQMASLGLGTGWLGLEELSLGGKEVGPGLLCASRLRDLKRLCLWACTLSELQIVRSCRMLRGLRHLQFHNVTFQPRQSPPVETVDDGEKSTEISDQDMTVDDPFPSLRRSLAVLLPSCTLAFNNCSIQTCAD